MKTLLLVHAHPDDEAVSTGGVILRAHDEGRRVVLLTATRGEEGEIHNMDEAAVRPRLPSPAPFRPGTAGRGGGCVLGAESPALFEPPAPPDGSVSRAPETAQSNSADEVATGRTADPTCLSYS